MRSAKLAEMERALVGARDEVGKCESRAAAARGKCDALRGDQSIREHLAANAELDDTLSQLEHARRAVEGLERRIAVERLP